MKISLIALAFLMACQSNSDGEMESSTINASGLQVSGNSNVTITNQNGETIQQLKIRSKELTGPRFKDTSKSHDGKPLTQATPTAPALQNSAFVQYYSGEQIPGIANGLERLENVATANDVTLNKYFLSFISAALAATGETKTLGSKDLVGAQAGVFFKKQINETSKVELKPQPNKTINALLTKKDGRVLNLAFSTSSDDTCSILDAALGERLSQNVIGKDNQGQTIGNPLGGNACSQARLNNFVLLNIYPANSKNTVRWALLVEKQKAASSRLWLFEVTPSAQQSQDFRKRIKAFL